MKNKSTRPVEKLYFAKIALILTAIILNLSCLKRYGIERYTRAVERPDVQILKNGSALIRTIYCNIYIERLDERKWEKLLKSFVYTKKPLNSVPGRIPKLTFFHLIIKNTTKTPIILDEIRLEYGKNVMDSLDSYEISTRTKSPSYSSMDFDSILSYRRLIEERNSVKEIDFDKETINSYFKFIPPFDTVTKIIVFDRVPVEFRKFRLIFIFNLSGIKKIIDFDFRKDEYRTKGEHFLKPENKDKEYHYKY